MNDVNTIISDINSNIRKFIELNYQSEIESKKLVNEKKEFLNTIHEQQLKIKELEEKNKILKISNSIELRQTTTEAKWKINEFVREIDKCISLLIK